jgi:hypothetical protein
MIIDTWNQSNIISTRSAESLKKALHAGQPVATATKIGHRPCPIFHRTAASAIAQPSKFCIGYDSRYSFARF